MHDGRLEDLQEEGQAREVVTGAVAKTTSLIQKVTFLSRAKAAALVPKGKAALISIHDGSEPELKVQKGWHAVLYLRFNDEHGAQQGQERFTPAMAQSVLDFVRVNGPSCGSLVVHCRLGESRSAGMALVLSEMLGVPCLQGGKEVNTHTYQAYSKAVHSRVLRAALNEPGEVFLHWCDYL